MQEIDVKDIMHKNTIQKHNTHDTKHIWWRNPENCLTSKYNHNLRNPFFLLNHISEITFDNIE